MSFKDIEDLRIVKEAEEICDLIWNIVIEWNYFVKDTIGKQVIKSSDSIGANIVESQGRYHPKDAINFLYMARGSLQETKYWLRRAQRRKLLKDKEYNKLINLLNNLVPQLNAFINSQKRRIK